MKKIKYFVVTGASRQKNTEIIAEAFDFGVLPEGYTMPPAQAGVFDKVWQPRQIRDIYLGTAADHIGSKPDSIYNFPHNVVSCLDKPTYVLGRQFRWGGDSYADVVERKVNYFKPIGLDCDFLPPSHGNLLFLVDRETFDANPDRMDLVIEGPAVDTDLFTDGLAVEWLIGRVEQKIPCLYGVWDVELKQGRSDVAIKVVQDV